MSYRNTFWTILLACIALTAIETAAWAVTEADVVRLKEKVVSGQQLTEAEVNMAVEARRLFGSKILDPQGLETPRQPHSTLDEYQFAQVAYEWIDITTDGTLAGITFDDQNVGPWNLGFTFTFFNQAYSSVRMCSNGWASFTGTSAEYFNGSIPSVTTPNNAVYPFWDDLFPPTGGQFYYFADAANQRFIMSWINVPHIGSTTELYTFQVVLYADGNIRFNYLLIPTGGVYGNSTCTVGIENAAGNEALQVCYDNAGTLPTSQSSILISQPDGVPAAPTGLTIENTAGGVVLNWINPTVDTNGNPVTPDHVEVWRGTSGAQVLVASLPSGTTTYTHTTPADSMRSYAIRACSPVFCGAFASGLVPVPIAPTNVVATPGASNVLMTWTDPVLNSQGGPANVTSVQIWMGQAGTGTLVGTVNAGVQMFDVTGLQSGNYTFSIRARSNIFSGASTGIGTVVGNPSYFSDFEADNGELISGGGWEWGTPSVVGPTGTHSGVNCWGTILAGNYGLDVCYSLDIDQELTVASTEAVLEFFMWYDSETNYDGMVIMVSVNGGSTWEVVQPNFPPYGGEVDGYIDCWVNIPAWSGTATTWQEVSVPMGAYVGQTPIIRFSFGSEFIIPDPGFYIDDVILWGFGEPEFAPVSGTVTLDGGAGTMTAVSVSANGIGNPITNPAANGTYSLAQVLVGNRRITASLAGYHPATQDIILAVDGLTDVNLTLVRLDPPVPTGLTGSVNSTTGLVTLNWTASTDPLVDVYPVYRRLQGQPTWVLQGSPATNSFTQTLTVGGIYQYAVSARDTNVTTPVESPRTNPVTILFGALPPTGLTANGVFDDRIALTWLTPGSSPAANLSYSDESSEVQGISWWAGAPEFGWMVARFATQAGPATVTHITPFWSDDAQIPFGVDVEVAVFEDIDGMPAQSPLGVTSFRKAGPGTFQDVELEKPVTVGSTFWVGVRQIGAQALGLGGDNDAPFITESFKYSFDGSTWTAFEPTLLSNPMLRCSAIGEFGGLFELSPAPVYVSESDLPAREEAIELKATSKTTSSAIEECMMTASGDMPSLEQLAARGINAVAPHIPRISARDRSRTSSLDDVVNYRVYRQGAGQIAQVNFGTNTYTDLNRIENTPYQYWVTAFYDNGEESPASNNVTASCNMAPAAPTSLTANPFGQTQMALAWVAPTTNADATPLVDLAGFRILRNGVQIGTTAAGVTTYTDTPPDNQTFYTWTVRAVDEVPNVSNPSNNAIGAVVSPWEVVDYDWVDITGVGTPAGIASDDQNVGPFQLGFTYTFFGNDYTSVRMCSNGWASFTSTSTAYTNQTIPTAAEPNNALFVFWDDMLPPTGQFLYYQDTANDRFIMSWIGVPHITNPAALYTYQIIIEESGGIIYNYHTVATATPGATSVTVGVENLAGTDGLLILFNNAGVFTPANETAIAFWAGPSGAISGLIRESQTAIPIEGAEISVAEAPGEVAFTDVQGNYTLGLEPGTYTLRVHKQGYCDQVFEDVVVVDGETTIQSANMDQPNVQIAISSLNIFAITGVNSSGQFEIDNPIPAQCDLEYSITTDQEWLSVSPTNGFIPSNSSVTIEVTAATAAFPVGEYEATIIIDHNDENSPFEMDVAITVALTADEAVELPTQFALYANYPNPFNATTALNFDVPNESLVQITIYNVTGQEVARPVNTVMSAGHHRVLYTADNLPTGMYLVKMTSGSFNAVQKMVLLK